MVVRFVSLFVILFAVFGSFAEPSSGTAPKVAPAAKGTLTMATERVIIFKDGHGLFVKSAEGVADGDGKVHTEQVPGAAVLGTFWAIAEKRTLKSTVADWYETVRPKSEEGSCLSTLELLRANKGKSVTLGLADKELSGKLIDLLEAPGLRSPQKPGPDGTYETELVARGGELLSIETERGRLVMPVAAVRTLLGKELSTHCVRPGEVATRSKRLTFDFGQEAAGKPVALKLFYFTPGVRWIPTYRVVTGTSSKAELELQGEILNEEEDFENAAVDLVVGVPSFKFNGTVSPMSLEQTLRSALAQAMPHLMNSNAMLSNANFNSRSGEEVDWASARAAPSVMSLAADLGAESRQDMFVYGVKGLGLRKGARAMVSLWRNTVPQRHLYTVDLGAFARTASDGAPLKLSENKVWHQLELHDDSDVPFTTGAAMVMEAGVPLGQDLLGYTSPGGKTMIPITVALNMRASQSEREVGRTAQAKVVDSTQYSLLQKKGSITLRNQEHRRATFRVSMATAGKVERASHSGTVVVDELDRVNNQSAVSWELTVGAGETVNLTYELLVYR